MDVIWGELVAHVAYVSGNSTNKKTKEAELA